MVPPVVNVPPADPPIYVYPAEYVERLIQPPAPNNASMEAQRVRNENIKRDQVFNHEIGSSISTITGIICDCISAGLNKVYAHRFLLNPYSFYRYLAATYGPAAAVNEDHNQCLFNLMKLKMDYAETFDVFMIGFNQKCEYLELNDHAKRGLLMTTYGSTDNKIQLLPERLTEEFKSIRERDLDFTGAVDWLRRQDVIQLNNGIKKGKQVKPVKQQQNEKNIKDDDASDEPKRRLKDGNGYTIIPNMQCHNCHNYGHGANRCKAEFCSSCRKPDPGHKWTKCPRGNQAKGSATKESQPSKYSKRGRSDESKVDETSKKTSYKKLKAIQEYEVEEDEGSLREIADDISSDEEKHTSRI